MTFETALARDNHGGVHYVLAFDGIEDVLATGDVTVSGVTGSYLRGLRIPTGEGSSLDRDRGIVKPGGFTAEVQATAEVRAFMARRGGTTDRLHRGMSVSSTTMQTEGGSFSGGDTVYIGQETVTLGTKSGDNYTGSTRAAHGSIAAAHARGAVVSTKPRHLKGRRATLYQVLGTGESKAVRTVMLRSSPRYADGIYTLEFVDFVTVVGNRAIMRGWQAVPATYYSSDGSEFTVVVGDVREFSTSANSHVRFDFPGGFVVFKLIKTDVDTANDRITVRWSNMVAVMSETGRAGDVRHDYYFTGLETEVEVTVRTVAWMELDPVHAALCVMESRTGNASNGIYDVLAGCPASISTSRADLIDKRCGAALPGAWVDEASWLEALGTGRQVFYLDEQMTLLDFLEDVAWRIGGYVYGTADGELAFRRYEAAVPDSSLETIDVRAVGKMATVTTVDDEEPILASAVVESDFDWLRKTYTQRTEAVWVETYEAHGEGRAQLKLQSKSLQLAGGSLAPRLATPVSRIQLLMWLDRRYARVAEGLRSVQIRLPWRWSLAFVPGYRFKLTDDRLPDGEGGLGVTARQHEVTGVSPEYEDGFITVTAEEQPTGFLVAPSAYVESWDGGTLRATLDTTGDEADVHDGSPAQDFPEGCTVRIYDASASPPFSVSDTAVASVISATVLELDSAPSFTPAAGDVIDLAYGANVGATNAADADVQDHLFQADSDGLLDAGGANERDAQVWS